MAMRFSSNSKQTIFQKFIQLFLRIFLTDSSVCCRYSLFLSSDKLGIEVQ